MGMLPSVLSTPSSSTSRSSGKDTTLALDTRLHSHQIKRQVFLAVVNLQTFDLCILRSVLGLKCGKQLNQTLSTIRSFSKKRKSLNQEHKAIFLRMKMDARAKARFPKLEKYGVDGRSSTFCQYSSALLSKTQVLLVKRISCRA